MNLLLACIVVIFLLILAVVAVRAIGGNITLVEDWQRAWRFYSTWGIVLLGALPDIYNAVVASGLLNTDDAPQQLAWAARLAALAGLMLRLVKQYKPPLPATDDTDQAGA